MKKIAGKYNTAIAFLNELEETATEQITELCNQEFIKDAKIRIMPDAHAGAGCVIGTTMTITDKIVPNLVGVDISCGILAVKIDTQEVDFERLDNSIRKHIPSGFDVHKFKNDEFDLKELKCFNNLTNVKHLDCSLGTLGGGNHFIEIDKDLAGNFWLLIHSGSRNIGKQVAEIYQHKAYNSLKNIGIHKDLAYLEDEEFQNYLSDMKYLQKWATRNREVMVEKIMVGMRWSSLEKIETIHNYIDIENMILRKGAVSAQRDEMLVIPINMRDGTLLCKGKGNPDWNFSAPHGAGRLMSRNQAYKQLSIDDFVASMKDVYTTTVSKKTLDEAPMAYKPIEEILEFVDDTLEVIDTMKPIYNFKAS